MVQVKKNVVPRKFNRITGKILIDTNMDKAGDPLHVYKNDCGYVALNLRTGKYAYVFPSMLRNGEIFEMTEVI